MNLQVQAAGLGAEAARVFASAGRTLADGSVAKMRLLIWLGKSASRPRDLCNVGPFSARYVLAGTALGPLAAFDVLINNAGRESSRSRILPHRTDECGLRSSISNLKGSLIGCRQTCADRL